MWPTISAVAAKVIAGTSGFAGLKAERLDRETSPAQELTATS